jgi:hypothetical protein
MLFKKGMKHYVSVAVVIEVRRSVLIPALKVRGSFVNMIG